MQRISHNQDHTKKNNVEDMILSINHRVLLIEKSLNAKIDRSQCMAICENKVTYSQLQQTLDDINNLIEQEKLERIARQTKIRDENQEKLKKVAARLSDNPLNSFKKKQKQVSSSSKNIAVIKPQQLYIQSNETIFSLIIDQINSIKTSNEFLQKQVLKRNKNNISLHNEICQKIQKMQQKLESQILTTEKKQTKQKWHKPQKEKPTKKYITHKNLFSNKTVNRMQHENTAMIEHESPSSIQQSSQSPTLEHFANLIESLEKQIANKLNIKDVLPMIKKNTQVYNTKIREVKQYAQEAIESTKKILTQQSEINQEICSIAKVGYWASYGEDNGNGFLNWNRQIANMVPEIFNYTPNSQGITIMHNGTYIVRIYSTASEDKPEYIMVNDTEIQMMYPEILIKIQNKNSILRLPSTASQIVLNIQKL